MQSNNLTTLLLLGLSVSTALNGIWMIFAPEYWYHTIPGVTHTGPFNAHFVQDVGAAYLAFATNIGLALIYREARLPLVLAGAVFMVAHAAFHLLDRVGGHSHAEHFWSEFFTVTIPAILCVLLVLQFKFFPKVALR